MGPQPLLLGVKESDITEEADLGCCIVNGIGQKRNRVAGIDVIMADGNFFIKNDLGGSGT
jgi:hypothetical protein